MGRWRGEPEFTVAVRCAARSRSSSAAGSRQVLAPSGTSHTSIKVRSCHRSLAQLWKVNLHDGASAYEARARICADAHVWGDFAQAILLEILRLRRRLSEDAGRRRNILPCCSLLALAQLASCRSTGVCRGRIPHRRLGTASRIQDTAETVEFRAARGTRSVHSVSAGKSNEFKASRCAVHQLGNERVGESSADGASARLQPSTALIPAHSHGALPLAAAQI